MDAELLKLNAQLQTKKNCVRRELNERGVLKREGKNDFDRYTYFSEAQYKLLFTEMLSKFGLELRFTELDYTPFEATGKNSNGRLVRLRFDLIDVETGFWEESVVTGEGMDKGDKAGYKADTGALKYYLANTFLVATGDDAEKESPDEPMNRTAARKPAPAASAAKASEKQIEILRKVYVGDNLKKLLDYNGVERLEDLTMVKASELISKLGGRKDG